MRCLSNTTDSCQTDAYHASGLLDTAMSMVHGNVCVCVRERKQFGFLLDEYLNIFLDENERVLNCAFIMLDISKEKIQVFIYYYFFK